MPGKLTKLQQRVLDEFARRLFEGGEQTPAAVAQALGLPPFQVRAIVAELVELGMLSKRPGPTS